MDKKLVGSMVKVKRIELGLSRKQLAALCFITSSHVKNVENGHRGMGEDIKKSVFNILGLSDELI